MKRYVEGENRSQSTLFPERLDDYIGEDNPVRVVDVFVDEMNLKELRIGNPKPPLPSLRRGFTRSRRSAGPPGLPCDGHFCESNALAAATGTEQKLALNKTVRRSLAWRFRRFADEPRHRHGIARVVLHRTCAKTGRWEGRSVVRRSTRKTSRTWTAKER